MRDLCYCAVRDSVERLILATFNGQIARAKNQPTEKLPLAGEVMNE